VIPSASSRRQRALLRHWLAAGALVLAAGAQAQTSAVGQAVQPATAVASTPAGGDNDCSALAKQGMRQVSQGELRLFWKPRPDPIPLNRAFELDVAWCGAGAELVRVDADMPAHRHGMNYRTTLEAEARQRKRAKGLLFHMAGQWRLIFEVQLDGQRLRLTDTIQLP
jgi:hypothetical protein